MNYSNMSLSGKVMFSSGIGMLLTLLLGAVGVYSVNSLTNVSQRVDYTHNVIEKSLLVEAAAVNMETGMRGYLLAGKEEFLEPLANGRRDFTKHIEELQLTVSDTPPLVKLLEDTQNTINQWLEVVVDPTISLRRTINDAKSMNHMSSWVQEERGKQYFDKFRGQIKQFIERESVLLEKRQKALSSSSSSSSNRQNRENIKWVVHTYKVINDAQVLLASAIDMETGMRGYLLAGRENFLEPLNNGKRNFDTLSEALKKTVSDNPAQVSLLNNIQETIFDWQQNVVNQSISLRKEIGTSKTMEDMAVLVGEARGKKYFDKFRKQISTFREKERKIMMVRKENAEDTVWQSYGMILGFILLAFTSTAIFTALLGRTVRGFSGLVKEMSVSANEVSSASINISGASQSLSRNSNHQAAAVEETSTSMEELSGIVRNNVRLTESSKELSNQVKDQMVELTEAMKEIGDSNERIEGLAKVIEEIGEKTSVIDEIVFQTQLLSFNASVEAERAGEHGRGFSVVAQEVGSLAQMSGKAALEISQIVKQSTEQVKQIAKENGARVERGDRIAEETRKQAEAVSKGAGQILNASSEQERGMSQIRQAIQSINRSTQQIATIAGEASNSSQNLEKQAVNVSEFVVEINDFLRGNKTEVQRDLQKQSKSKHQSNRQMPNNVYQHPGSNEPREHQQVASYGHKKVVGDEYYEEEAHDSSSEDGWKKI